MGIGLFRELHLIQRKTDMSLVDYLMPRLFEPMGIPRPVFPFLSGRGGSWCPHWPGSGISPGVPGLLQKAYPNIRVLNVTAGVDGSYSFYGDADPIFVPACTLCGVIETTGAGDTFCASVLDYALTHGLENLTPENRREMLRFANTAAYIATTRKGAIRAMPREEEVRALL